MEEESSNQPFIEIEGPVFLAEGQNFYEQQPFDQILQDVSRQHGVDIAKLRRFLTQMAKQVNSYSLLPQRHDEIILDVLYIENVRKHLEMLGLPREEGQLATRDLNGKLLVFPYWDQYIATQLSSATHNSDGIYNLKGNRYVPVETYAKYASDKLRREKQLRVLGIDEVFPQDFSQESPLGASVPSGSLGTNRKWRILKASELVKE